MARAIDDDSERQAGRDRQAGEEDIAAHGQVAAAGFEPAISRL
jgi:hypothetical protein